MAQLGVHGLAVAPRWDVGEWAPKLPRLKHLGATLVEIPLLRPAELDADATRKLAEKAEISLVCSLGLPPTIDLAARPDEAHEWIEAALEKAARAGASALSGVTYTTIGHITGAPPTEAELDAVARFLVRAGKSAAARGLKLGIEPCNRYETHLVNTGAQARAMLEKVGLENMFIHLDTYHMTIEEQSLTKGFADAGDMLGYVHVSESNRGVPGRGNVDWGECFAALAAQGYDGQITLESFVHMDADLAGALAIWRPVAENPDDVLEIGLPFLRTHAEAAGVDWSA